MLSVEHLDDATVEPAGALLAREHAAARQARPELPARYDHPEACTAALQGLRDAGHTGVVVVEGERLRGVLTGIVDDTPGLGRYLRLPAEGFAVDPALADPTRVLALLYGEYARESVAAGVPLHVLEHVALPPLHEGLANLAFRRANTYAVQPAAHRAGPPRSATDVRVHVAGAEHLETFARLTQVMNANRTGPPMFATPDDRPLDELVAEHRARLDGGATHLLASLDGRDVGLLTIEPTSSAPRLCPAGEPFIGPTATVPQARGHGVGRALVDAALDWARDRGHAWLSVDFEPANALSRPFWLSNGFRPTGHTVVRTFAAAR